MVKKLITWYLRKMLRQSQFEEESLEMFADTTENVNEIWQKQRVVSNAIKTVLKELKPKHAV